MMFGFFINVFAMTVYKMMRMASGKIKKMETVAMKKNAGQN